MRSRALLTLVLLIPLIAVFKLVDLVARPFLSRRRAHHLSDTLRLYCRKPEGLRFTWIWEYRNALYVDDGLVGEAPRRRRLPLSDWTTVLAEIEDLRAGGYAEMGEDDWQFLQVIWRVDGNFASIRDLRRRNAAMSILEEAFALTGQGYWVDASSGMGTCEVGFLVADYDSARRTAARVLRDTPYGDYLAIRDSDALAGAEAIAAGA